MEEIKEKIEKIESKKRKVKKFATITAFALSGVLSKVSITTGIASFIGGFIIPSSIIDMIFKGITERIKGEKVRESIRYIHTLWTPSRLLPQVKRKEDD